VAPSSRVLAFIGVLCGLAPWQQRQIESVAWVLADKHPNHADDIVQEMALRAWTNRLFGRGTNTGDLIAAANRAANERR
jgi:hypothetical protein